MDRVTLRRRLRLLLRVGVLAIAIATLVAMRRQVSLARVAEVLRAADLALLGALVLPLLALNFVIRAARFRALFGNRAARPPFGDVLRAVLLGHGANNVLPMRAGEVVRTRELAVRGSPVRRVVAAQVAEKVVELASILVWIAPGIDVLFPGHPRLVFVAEGALLAALGVWALIAARRDGSTDRLASIVEAFLWSLVADGLEIALIAVCAASVGVHASLTTCAVVLGTTNLAIALPSTPGQLGTFEAGSALGLVLTGFASDRALAFALVYRVVQWVPITLAAGILWVATSLRGISPSRLATRLGRKRPEIRAKV